MAEGLLKKMLKERLGEVSKEFHVFSAGLSAFSGYAMEEAFQVMKGEGVDLSNFRSRQLTTRMVEEADLILTMKRSHKYNILVLHREAEGKVFTLKEFSRGTEKPDIADPYGKGMGTYRACAKEIKNSLNKAFEKIIRF